MKLYFKSFGSGYPVIILHGLFGTLDNWYTLASRLSDSFRVYAVDQRNHGRSPHHESHTYSDLAQDVFLFMRQHGIDEAHLLGHSMGGTVVMQFAHDHPEMVDRLVVVDMAPRDYEPRHDAIFEALDAVEPATFATRKEIEAALEPYLRERVVRQFMLKNITRDQNNRFQWKFNLDAIKRNYSSIISGPAIDGVISNPTLFIRGEKSQYITEGDTERIRRLFPNARVVTIPEAGHWVHADRPKEFLNVVRNFLSTGTEDVSWD